MNIYLVLAILLANVISIAIVYQFIKRLDNKEKLLFIAISVAIMYILISIVYWISGFGISKKIHEATKNFVLYLFVPVNVILFIPYFASQYMKLKENHIKVEKFTNKVSILIVLLLIVLVVEYFYFKSIQQNIKQINTNQNQIDVQEEITNPIDNSNVINTNSVNEIKNTNILNNNVNANYLEW